MSAKKPSYLSKILTGVVTTFVAPMLATVVAQQVGEWQDTVKCLVENQFPALAAEARPHAAWNKSLQQHAGNKAGRPTPPVSLMPPVGRSGDWPHPGYSGREVLAERSGDRFPTAPAAGVRLFPRP